jgi:hypothetical protein
MFLRPRRGNAVRSRSRKKLVEEAAMMTNTVGRHLPRLFVGLLGAGAFAAVATARGEPVAPTVQEGGVPGYDVSG